MRLIDADALVYRLEHSTTDTWARDLKAVRNWWPHAVGIKDNIVSLILNAPTADAVPVVHGRWRVSRASEISKTVWCTACGEEIYIHKNDTLKIDRMPYCPNCGAKMDGDGSE